MQQAASRKRPFAMFGLQDLREMQPIYNWFEKMRAEQPVYYDEGMRMWHVFRYEDVRSVLNDHSRFSSHAYGMGRSFLGDTLVGKDPPDHRKLRNLVNQAFTPRSVAHLEGRIQLIAQELLDEVRSAGKMDIVSDIAFPLPAKVIAEMLGVPSEDWNIFQRWARMDSSGPGSTQQDNGRSMQEEMSDYFARLLKERRRAPREDLVSALSVAEVDGERLSEHELISFCMLLLAAGQETTKNLIANATVCFTDHADALAHLKREPALIPTAIEEVLRYLPPVWFVMRMTTSEIELAGQRIPANQIVVPWMASGNRDAAQFSDPNRFDIERAPNRHVTFGHGIHFCIGAPLARLEAKVTLPMMLEQLKDLRVVEDTPIKAHMGLVFVIRSLPVTFQPY